MKNLKYLIYLCIVAFVFHSCAVGPDFKKPNYQMKKEYKSLSSVDTTLNLNWWDFYDDPILDTLISKALYNNQDLLMAAARIEQSKANLGFNKADQFPKFNLSAGSNYGNYANGFYSSTANGSWGITPQLSWEIDFWGKYRRATEAARAKLVSNIYGLRSIQMSVISEVARNYFLLLDYKQRLEIANKTFETRDSSQKIIEARYENGVIPEIDLNQAQIQTAISASSIPVYERQIGVIENNISLLIGELPDSILTNTNLFSHEIPDSIPSGVPSLLLRRRPDVLAAEADLHEQVAKIGVAQAMRFPSFSINGALGAASNLSLIGLGWGVGANLFGPLFQFNKNKRRMEAEKFKAEEVAFKYEKTVISAVKEVEDNLISIQTLKVELEARNQHRIAAQNAERLSMERYNKGVTSYLEVLEVQGQSFQAQLEYTRVYQELLSYYILLYKSLGGGWISEGELEKAQNQNKLFEEFIVPFHDLPPKERKKALRKQKKEKKEAKKKK